MCHSQKIRFVICQNYTPIAINKKLSKINDTVAPLDTCDISFSLASNSHGNGNN